MKWFVAIVAAVSTVTLINLVFTATGLAETSQLEKLRNATYTGIEAQPVRLTGGRWEGSPYVEGGASRPAVGLVEEMVFTGDMNADGNDETIAILWQSAGATGSNSYIALMSRQGEELQNTATALIGDRVRLRQGEITAGKFVLDVLQAGENDAMCCPTQLATRTWSLQGDQLKEEEMQETGKLSLAMLNGTDWVLTHTARDTEVAEDVEITLTFNANRISGKSACNSYNASARDGEKAGEILFGLAMVTMMSCPEKLMKAERQYLAALSEVKSFSFRSGRLALTADDEDKGMYTMLFRRLQDGAP
jgi:heat shock protein HslJ